MRAFLGNSFLGDQGRDDSSEGVLFVIISNSHYYYFLL